jgi:hypothetical protein
MTYAKNTTMTNRLKMMYLQSKSKGICQVMGNAVPLTYVRSIPDATRHCCFRARYDIALIGGRLAGDAFGR